MNSPIKSLAYAGHGKKTCYIGQFITAQITKLTKEKDPNQKKGQIVYKHHAGFDRKSSVRGAG